MPLSQLPFAKRLRRCVAVGLAIGIVFCVRGLVGTGLVLVQRPQPTASVLPYLAVYLGGGTFGGFLVALAAPLLRWLGGAFVVGVVATFPTLFGLFALDPSASSSDAWAIGGILSLFIGGALGAFEWVYEERRPYKLMHIWLFAAVCTVVAWFVGLHWAGQWQAVGAIFLFLIPVMIALIVTIASADAAR